MIPIKMSETPSTNFSMIHAASSEGQVSYARHCNVIQPVVAKRISFYKSGDPQFSGIQMVVNPRSFKTFDALLDNLSKKVPLPFGVRNISTPQGIHSITKLEDLEDGRSYICSHRKKIKPIDLEKARQKPLPWQSSRPVSARRRAAQMARAKDFGLGYRELPTVVQTPRKLLVFKNGDPRTRQPIILSRKITQNFEAFLDHLTELMQYPVVKLYTTDGRKVPSLQAVILSSGAVVAAGREPFKPGNYDLQKYLLSDQLPRTSRHIYPKGQAKPQGRMIIHRPSSPRSQIYSVSSDKIYSNDNNSDCSLYHDNDLGLEKNDSQACEDISILPSEDDIEKSILVNQDGTMTVEMKVRFKIKEEETLKWTTTVSRVGLPNNDKKSETCSFLARTEDQSPAIEISTCTNSTDVPSLEKCENEEESLTKERNPQVIGRECDIYNDTVWEDTLVNTDIGEMPRDQVKHHFHRPPTPGPRRVRQKKSLLESITLVSETEVEEKMIGQFSYSEERQDGESKSEYHMFTHSSSKMSSVTNKPKLSEFNSDNSLKSSLESKAEDRMLLSRPQSGSLIEITSQKTLEVNQIDSLSQTVQDKSVIEEGIPCVKNFISYDAINDRIRPFTTDVAHFCVSESGTELSHGETVSEIPTSVDPSPVITNIDRLVSEFAQCGITSTPSSERLILPLGSRKKKGKKSQLQVVNSEQSQHNKENATKKNLNKNEKVDFNSETIQEDMSQSSHCTERTVVLQVGSKKATNRTVYANSVSSKSNLNLSISKILPSIKFLAARRIKDNGHVLGKAKHKAVKKMSFPGSTKKESSVDKKDFPQNDIKYGKNTLGIEDARHIRNVRDQVPKSLNAQKSVASGYMTGTEKKNSFSKVTNLNTSLRNQKKQKLSKLKSDAAENKQHSRTWDHSFTSLKKVDFLDDIAHHSVQNYIQTWLQNVFPPPILPSEKLTLVNKQEGDMENYSGDCLPNLIQAISEKESEAIIENKTQTTSNPPLDEYSFDGVANKSPTKQDSVEELAKEICEREIESLTNASLVSLEEQVTPSVFHEYEIKNQAANEEIHHSTKNSEVDIDLQGKKPDFKKQSVEAEVQVSAGDTSVIMNNMPMDLFSGLLLHQMQAFVLNLQKNQNGTVKIPYPHLDFSSLSSPLYSSSTNLLLAWLLLLNLKGSLDTICQGDNFNMTSKSSEIFTLLEFLKNVAIVEKADDLETAVSHLKESATTCLGLTGKEQIPIDVSGNSSPDEIKNGNEKNKEVYASYEGNSVEDHGTEDTPIFPEISALSNAFSPTENYVLDQTCSLDEPCFLEEDFFHNGGKEESEICISMSPCPPEEDCVMSKTCVPNDVLDSEEKNDNLELIEELEKLDRLQEDLIMSEELNDLSVHELVPFQNENMGSLSNCSPFPNETIMEPSEKQEEIPLAEFQNGVLSESQDKNTDMSFDKEDSRTSEEPGSTPKSMTSGERNISELESFEEIENQDKINFNVEENVGGGQDKLGAREKITNKNPELIAFSDGGVVEEEKRNDEYCEKRLTKLPSLDFCYDSKQSPEKDTHEGENNVQVKMKMISRNHSNPSPISRKCLKSPVTSDLSDYRPDTESEPTYKTSSDLTNESGEEIVQERAYNTGFVKRTIERLYGKEETIKPCLLIGSTKESLAFHASSSESIHGAQKASPYQRASQCQTFNSPRQVSHYTSTLQSSWEEEIPENITCAEDISSIPSINGVKVNHHRQNVLEHRMEQYNHSKIVRGIDEGVLIDKGKWLLKENHLLRLSSLENTGMYGNVDTTSVDTLLDNNSDEIPYSHFGNLGKALADISSSEIEEMAQPLEPRCNYFNMPHGSDSDPFHDDSLRIQNKIVNTNSIPNLHENMEDNQQLDNVCTSLACVYTMPGNKIHPVGHPVITEGPIKSQPSPSINRNSAILQEGDSLDKLYAVCGQHCPILTAVIHSVNENDRGFVYQKASDIENLGGFHLWTLTPPHLLCSDNSSFRDENNNVNVKKTLMDNISSDTFARFYLNSTLDLIKRRDFGMLNSLATENGYYLKECEMYSRKSFYICFLQAQLFVMDKMNSNKQGSSNQGNEISIAVDENNNLLNNKCQSSRAQKPNG